VAWIYGRWFLPLRSGQIAAGVHGIWMTTLEPLPPAAPMKKSHKKNPLRNGNPEEDWQFIPKTDP